MDRNSQRYDSDSYNLYDQSDTLGSWVEQTSTFQEYRRERDPTYRAKSYRTGQPSSSNDQSTLNASSYEDRGHKMSTDGRESYRSHQERNDSLGNQAKDLSKRRELLLAKAIDADGIAALKKFDVKLARYTREVSAARGGAHRQEVLDQQKARREEGVKRDRGHEE